MIFSTKAYFVFMSIILEAFYGTVALSENNTNEMKIILIACSIITISTHNLQVMAMSHI